MITVGIIFKTPCAKYFAHGVLNIMPTVAVLHASEISSSVNKEQHDTRHTDERTYNFKNGYFLTEEIPTR